MSRVVLVLLCLHLVPVVAAMVWGTGAFWLAVAGLAVVMAASIALPHGFLGGRAVRAFPAAGRTIHLTIDDGPCADTRAVLDLLAAHDVRAVFFLIGDHVRARPDDARAIVAGGHLVGNHTQTHPAKSFWAYLPWMQDREISACQQAIHDACGVAPAWFRAPVGLVNPFLIAVAARHGLRVMGWNARGFDTRGGDVDGILHAIRKDIRPGGIILVHQGHPHSIALLRRLLDHLATNGWQCVLPDGPHGQGARQA
jgi:peptidoglycan/xylan/chitin deacetylase (PgdA/CDA1 family)